MNYGNDGHHTNTLIRLRLVCQLLTRGAIIYGFMNSFVLDLTDCFRLF
jgi:hypothetical protein